MEHVDVEDMDCMAVDKTHDDIEDDMEYVAVEDMNCMAVAEQYDHDKYYMQLVVLEGERNMAMDENDEDENDQNVHKMMDDELVIGNYFVVDNQFDYDYFVALTLPLRCKGYYSGSVKCLLTVVNTKLHNS